MTASPALQEALAFKYAVEMVNSDDSVLPNVTVVYQIRDALTLGFFLNQYDVGIVTYSATFELPEYSVNFLRTIPPAREEIRALVSLLGVFNWTLVTPVFSTDIYGLSGRHAIDNLAGSHEIRFPCITMIKTGMLSRARNVNERSILNLISCIKSIPNLSVVLLYMNPLLAMAVIKIFYKEKIKGITFIFSEASSEILYQPSRISIDFFPYKYILGTFDFHISTLGSISISPYITPYEALRSYIAIGRESENYRQYTRMWEDTFKCFYFNPDEPIPDFAKKIPVCDLDVAHRKFPFNCRCTGEEILSPTSYSLFVVNAVKSVAGALNRLIEKCQKPLTSCSEISGKDIIDEMKREIVEGVYGPVGFKEANPIDSKYSFLQAISKNATTIIGDYQNGAVNIDFSKTYFYLVNKIPISRVVPLENSFDSAGGILLCACAVFLVLLSFALIVIVWKFRERKPIKVASPIFCEFILVGVVLCNISVILNSVRPSYLVCSFKLWSLVIGFSLVIANMLAKTYRIFKIFSVHRPSTLVTKNSHLFIFTGSLLLINVIVLCLFTFTKLAFEPKVVSSPRSPYFSFVICSQANVELSNVANIFLLIFLVFILFLVLLLAVLAFLVRKVDSQFNESFHIAITVYTYVLVLVIATPLYIISGALTDPISAKYYEVNISLLVMMAVTLAAIFYPKFLALWRENKANRSIESEIFSPSISDFFCPRVSRGDVLTGDNTDSRSIASSRLTEVSPKHAGEDDIDSSSDEDKNTETLNGDFELTFISFDFWDD
ncbi:gamma-aminobutyric acid type B receptor [Mitosporidium daphniae]|uniref:Gamma-aminobutyric acid type B receptor n=1 Tax=Mitosporidium daphniae TaxID=1485682 RepID=A0A098VWG0_9MICR|nr:gamma-aminobutyric acid type B receptor [Mitosporidium daphniae]KGG52096.1 gamma-aminobutyric acid type B receptor [Mitosporidium daphniae]|eukprot:XP_013238523.1 gamma-aminobutyric acid type B receptor [Mitosporidium daphniae]